MNLPEPSLEYAQGRLLALKNDQNFYGAERSLELVFKQWPDNLDFDQVAIKTIVLNRAYSTGIYDVWTVARHIHRMGIDERLRAGDDRLIHEIAAVTIKEKQFNFYSFATKYCSWHEPEKYQIYDSYVAWLLWLYRKQFRFASFRKYELSTYPRFVEIIEQLRSRFRLGALGRKELDKFLYSEGREQWKTLKSRSVRPPDEVS